MSAPVDELPRVDPSAPAVRVLIVEDDRLVALDLEMMLTEFGFTPCATAHSGDEALRQASAHKPDLVLMDIRLEGESDGIEAAQRLRDELGVRVVYLTANSDLSTVERAKQTQPFGYLLKPIRPLDLRCCLELALHQTRFEHARLEHASAEAISHPNRDPRLVSTLSAREREVLAMIARGHTSKDIARTLQIAKPTVDTYRSRLCEKLGAKSRTELVSIATRSGLVAG